MQGSHAEQGTQMVPPEGPLGSSTDEETVGHIEVASRLAGDVLLLVGWFPLDEEYSPEVWVGAGPESTRLPVRWLAYQRSDVAQYGPRPGKLLVVDLPPAGPGVGATARNALEHLEVRAGNSLVSLDPAHQLSDLRTVLREGLAWLDPEVRTEITAFLTRTLVGCSETPRLRRLHRELAAIREALRERLPPSVVAPDQRASLSVEALLAIDERRFYARGWLWDDEDEVTHLTAVSPEGSRAEILGRAFRFPHPDAARVYTGAEDRQPEPPGFVCHFELDSASALEEGWVFELRDAGGSGVEALAPMPPRDIIATRDSMLGDLVHERDDEYRLASDHVHPAISRLRERRRSQAQVERTDQYGIPPINPVVSVVVPLYRRTDFLEHQLAQFVHDPEVAVADLIYVLDSPELGPATRQAAAQLERLYRVPFRLVTLCHNVGIAPASNLAAALARGRLLLRLDSDVLPDRPGWLGQMVEFYDLTPGIGALGPKLMYEDDSLQHAGLHFSYDALAGVWDREHSYKGLHRRLPVANLARQVPAVTGACLMIDLELYRRMGGLSDAYVQGGFEDADLCLRLAEAGYATWYLPSVELYHLEGQSYPAALRALTARYNRWLFTCQWGRQLEAAAARHDAHGASPPQLVDQG